MGYVGGGCSREVHPFFCSERIQWGAFGRSECNGGNVFDRIITLWKFFGQTWVWWVGEKKKKQIKYVEPNGKTCLPKELLYFPKQNKKKSMTVMCNWRLLWHVLDWNDVFWVCAWTIMDKIADSGSLDDFFDFWGVCASLRIPRRWLSCIIFSSALFENDTRKWWIRVWQWGSNGCFWRVCTYVLVVYEFMREVGKKPKVERGLY